MCLPNHQPVYYSDTMLSVASIADFFKDNTQALKRGELHFTAVTSCSLLSMTIVFEPKCRPACETKRTEWSSPWPAVATLSQHSVNAQKAMYCAVIKQLWLYMPTSKCPFSSRDDDIVASQHPFLMETDGALKVNEEHEYYDQIQVNMFFSDRQRCDFCVWTTKDIKVIRVERDIHWCRNIAVVINFYKEVFLPNFF